MFPVGRSGEETRPCPRLYAGLLSSSEECAGLWLVVALAGVNNSGNTLSNCRCCHDQYLIVAASIAPISEGFPAAPQLLNFFFKYNFDQVLCFLFVEAVLRGYIKLCNDLFIISVWSDVKLWPP